jgi:hypothetical protein
MVFGGTAFRREEFAPGATLRGYTREASTCRKHDSHTVGDYLQFSDARDDYAGLDPMTEALDLLRSCREELLRLSRLPGITVRHLLITANVAACTLELEAEDISLLHDLGLSLSVVPCPSHAEDECPTIASSEQEAASTLVPGP